MNDVMGIRQIEDWKTIWATRDGKTRVPTKRFLCFFDVKGIAYTLVVVGAGFRWTCDIIWVHITRGVSYKEKEEDDVGENHERREGFEEKEEVHFGGVCIEKENIERGKKRIIPKKIVNSEIMGYGHLLN